MSLLKRRGCALESKVNKFDSDHQNWAMIEDSPRVPVAYVTTLKQSSIFLSVQTDP